MKEVLITRGMVEGFIGGQRRADSDKRDYGDLLIFAGKEGMAGSAILAARAALRSGAGLVKVATHKGNFPIIQTAIPEAICIEADDALLNLDYYTAIVVGPGMGADERTERIVAAALKNAPISTPILIDADGLNVLATSDVIRHILCDRCKGTADSNYCGSGNLAAGFYNTVITPHKREADRLLGRETIDTASEISSASERTRTNAERDSLSAVRQAACIELAETFNCIALLKGSGTLIATPCADTIYRNTTGNPGMATAGSGDVLSGIIGSLMAQGVKPLEATISGAFIHGLAGDLAAEKLGERSVIASDIIEFLPVAFPC